MSRVDVIVPCYNYGRFLRECVESVLSQPVDLRVLIIDDASTDDTPEVAAALAAEDARVEVRRHSVNRGHIATYNEGLEWVAGDYNLLLSADDLLVEGALLRASRLMDANPGVGLVYGRAVWFQTSHTRPAMESAGFDEGFAVLSGLEWLESLCKSGQNPITSPEAIVRSRLQKDLGGYRRELPHTADMEMWMRFAIHGDVVKLEAPQAYYRIHGQNMSDSYYDKVTLTSLRLRTKDLLERKAAFDLLFREQGVFLQDCDRLKRLTQEGLAWSAFWCACMLFDQSDSAGCDEFLGLAGELFPEIVSRPEWSRMRWKQRLGTRAWSKLSHLVRSIRSGRRSISGLAMVS
ncbi:MAG: glycosyltransferase [Isosphaeraceae bacterium]